MLVNPSDRFTERERLLNYDSVLHDVFSVTDPTEHAVGDGVQPTPVFLEYPDHLGAVGRSHATAQ